MAPNSIDAYYETSGPHPDAEPSINIDRSRIRTDRNRVTATLNIVEPGMAVMPVQYSRSLIASLNGKPIYLSNYKGLVALALPAGEAEIFIQRIEPIGFIASLAAGILLICLLILMRRPYRTAAASNAP